MHYGRVRRA